MFLMDRPDQQYSPEYSAVLVRKAKGNTGMTEHVEDMPPVSVVRVEKLAVTPTTSEGLRSFAQVEVEIVRDSGIAGLRDSVRVSVDFNVDGLTADQIKDFAILHAKELMNRCVTDPHPKIGAAPFQD
jgi:hypothetical protein